MSPGANIVISEARILHEKPLSGVYEEVLFGTARNNTLWILFSDEYGLAEWVGKFDCGCASTVLRVTKATAPDNFLVIAGGFIYLIDAGRREVSWEWKDYFTGEVIFDAETDYVIKAEYDLSFMKDGEEVFRSERISFDSIRDLKLTGRILSGTATIDYDGTEAPFEFDLNTKTFHNNPDLLLFKHTVIDKLHRQTFWQKIKKLFS